jgi:hypothetical protein
LTGENPFYLTALAAAHAEAGNRIEAEIIIARLAEISETRFVSEYMLSLVYCALNDKEKAFENLEKALPPETAGSSGSASSRNSTCCAMIRVSTICCTGWIIR